MHTKRQAARGECCKSQFNQGRQQINEEQGEIGSVFHDHEEVVS